ERTAARLLRAPACRGRPRGRRGHGPRARAPARHARDDRLGELRAAGDPRVPGQRAHQQVRRGLSGQALLRR
ncbi:MAG: Serine hydroxymethyltransferase, partial [uncultured Solirubrobacteraceae bacterium]